MTLVGTQFVVGIAQNNFKNEMAKTYARGNAGIAVGSFKEVLMMTYLWACCLKRSARVKDLQASHAKVSKALDIRKLYDKLEEKPYSRGDLDEK